MEKVYKDLWIFLAHLIFRLFIYVRNNNSFEGKIEKLWWDLLQFGFAYSLIDNFLIDLPSNLMLRYHLYALFLCAQIEKTLIWSCYPAPISQLHPKSKKKIIYKNEIHIIWIFTQNTGFYFIFHLLFTFILLNSLYDSVLCLCIFFGNFKPVANFCQRFYCAYFFLYKYF